MSFDWTEYLRLSEKLTGAGTTPPSEEGKLRCAISRAYYAAHHCARNYLRDIQRIPEKRDHGYVRKWFQEAYYSTPSEHRLVEHKTIELSLQRLQGKRIKADYEAVYLNADVRKLRVEANRAVAEANDVLSCLQRLLRSGH